MQKINQEIAKAWEQFVSTSVIRLLLPPWWPVYRWLKSLKYCWAAGGTAAQSNYAGQPPGHGYGHYRSSLRKVKCT